MLTSTRSFTFEHNFRFFILKLSAGQLVKPTRKRPVISLKKNTGKYDVVGNSNFIFKENVPSETFKSIDLSIVNNQSNSSSGNTNKASMPTSKLRFNGKHFFFWIRLSLAVQC